jgi:TRAP-type uncharacterized transport system substrate-binding protein
VKINLVSGEPGALQLAAVCEVVLAVLAFSSLSFAVEMNLMTGREKGTYYQFGLNLQQLVKPKGIPLYNEEIHLLGRRDIADFDNLTGKRVAVGEDGSSTFLTARLLFEVSGIKPKEMVTIGWTANRWASLLRFFTRTSPGSGRTDIPSGSPWILISR